MAFGDGADTLGNCKVGYYAIKYFYSDGCEYYWEKSKWHHNRIKEKYISTAVF